MKKIFTLVALVAALCATAPARAQVKLGLKGGLNVTNMSLSSEVFDQSNQTGFFIGPVVKVTLPVVGLGIDGAILYDQRDAKLNVENDKSGMTDKSTSQRSINVPINLRYSFGLGDMAGLYLAAGPQFGYNVGTKNYSWGDAANYELKKSNFSVNVGVGVTLVNHLEIGATYNIACGKTGEINYFKAAQDILGTAYGQQNVRSNAWQVNVAYFF